MIVFVHGAGRAGRAAWPKVEHEGARYLNLSAVPQPSDQAAVVEEATDAGAVVVAHSYGALAAVLAGRRAPERIRGFVLVEPALYDVARGDPAVRRFIEAMEHARREYDRAGLEAYWAVVRPLMFGGSFAPDRWASEEAIATRMHGLADPWGHGITAGEVTSIRTLVITGGWNAEYQAIGASLARAGADHRVLAGARHRPHDLAEIGALLDEFVDGLPGRASSGVSQ